MRLFIILVVFDEDATSERQFPFCSEFKWVTPETYEHDLRQTTTAGAVIIQIL